MTVLVAYNCDQERPPSFPGSRERNLDSRLKYRPTLKSEKVVLATHSPWVEKESNKAARSRNVLTTKCLILSTALIFLLLKTSSVFFLQDFENQMDIAEKRRQTLLKDFLVL